MQAHLVVIAVRNKMCIIISVHGGVARVGQNDVKQSSVRIY